MVSLIAALGACTNDAPPSPETQLASLYFKQFRAKEQYLEAKHIRPARCEVERELMRNEPDKLLIYDRCRLGAQVALEEAERKLDELDGQVEAYIAKHPGVRAVSRLERATIEGIRKNAL